MNPEILLDFDMRLALWQIATIGVAYVLALPIAWDREKESRSAGLRTFPLVATATCGFAMLGLDLLDDSPARILQGVITGIGFIGGGAILKNQSSVSGTATAASFWCVGVIGIAVAYGRLEIAVTVSLVAFVTLRYVKYLK